MVTAALRGGPADRPYSFSRGGFTWRVFGKAGRTFATIQLTNEGEGRAFRTMGDTRRNDLKRFCNAIYARTLEPRIPIDTGQLQTSLRQNTNTQNRAVVQLGPRPWRPGGVYSRGRRKGRPRVNRYYARWVNRRSKRDRGYIEKSATIAAREMKKAIRRFERAIEQEQAGVRRLGSVGHLLRGTGGTLR